MILMEKPALSRRLTLAHVALMLFAALLMQVLLSTPTWQVATVERLSIGAVELIWTVGAIVTLLRPQNVRRIAEACVVLSAVALCHNLWFAVADASVPVRAAIFSSRTAWFILITVTTTLVCRSPVAWSVALLLLASLTLTGGVLLPLTDAQLGPRAVSVFVNASLALFMAMSLMPLMLQLLRLRASVDRQTQSLERTVGTDALTGLPNRRLLGEWLNSARERVDSEVPAGGQSPVWAMTLMDLDGFKAINDVNGHVCGDMVLAQLADLIRRSAQPVEMTGRWGGEEFMIVGQYSSLQAALNRVERLRGLMSHARWPESLRVTASYGVTLLRSGETVRDAISRADSALYSAKSRGRDAVGVQS